MTADVGDSFHVESFFTLIERREWDADEGRGVRNTDPILELCERMEVKATFFSLAWVAERYPALIRRIVAGGHELASHGLAHFRADSQEPAEFLRDGAR